MLTLAEVRSLLQKPTKQPNFQGNVVASGKLTARIPNNGTQYMVILHAMAAGGADLTVAQMKNDIGTVIFRLNGKPVWEVPATFLLDRQKYFFDVDGTAAGNINGYIPIHLYLPHLESDPERRVLGWGMADVTSFEVEVNLKPGLATLASLELSSVVSDEIRPLGRHLRIRTFPQNFPTTGAQEISTLARENGNTDYGILHIEAGAGTFKDVTVKVNNVVIHDQVTPGLNQLLLTAGQRTPQTGYYHVDFTKRNDLSSILPMAGVNDFRQSINWITAAPGNFNIYAEMLFNDLQS